MALVGVIVAGALLLSGCAANPTPNPSTVLGLSDGFGNRATNRTAIFITYYNPASEPFWHQIFQGATDAAKLGALEFTHITANAQEETLLSNIKNAIDKKPAFLFVPFNLGERQTALACQAKAAGIKVFAYNVPPAADAVKCVTSFVGQDFFEVGKIVGNALLDAAPELKKGDKVLLPAEHAEQPYAVSRGGGVNAALAAHGIKGVFLSTGDDDATTLANLNVWLKANPDVKAVVPLGGTPHRNIYAAMKSAGLHPYVIGFDTAPAIVSAIKSGEDLGTADQQGYVQGFQTVMQAVLLLDFGLLPANINSGGTGLITKANLAPLLDPKLKGIRY
jgi:simple sugar transport system substrate-binding protein